MGKLVGSWITKRRELKGISQAQLAKRLGVNTAQSVSNIERGIAPLPHAHVSELSRALGVKRELVVNKVVEEFRKSWMAASGKTKKAAPKGKKAKTPKKAQPKKTAKPVNKVRLASRVLATKARKAKLLTRVTRDVRDLKKIATAVGGTTKARKTKAQIKARRS
jgi:transcriptional regulator with XRE-family HTH domain